MSAWTDIEDATSASYMPVEADANMYLRATATYTDAGMASRMSEQVRPREFAAEIGEA